MTADEFNELRQYLEALPRPLPQNIQIGPGQFVGDPDVMISSHMGFIGTYGLGSALSRAYVDRLLMLMDLLPKIISERATGQ